MTFDIHLPLKDRREAGCLLAAELAWLHDEPDLLVLGLPRGGVPVAFEIAQALQAPLDVFVVRKIGLPGHPEYAAGAIASGGLLVMDVLPSGPAQVAQWQAVLRRETAELERRERVYRFDRPALNLHGHTVVLVDDGLATGATMEAAARAVRQQQPRQLIVAAPVASVSAAQRLAPWVDQRVFGAVPKNFRAVSQGYRQFSQTTDEEVLACLRAARHQPAAAASP